MSFVSITHGHQSQRGEGVCGSEMGQAKSADAHHAAIERLDITNVRRSPGEPD